jgi:hypothetical protein
LPLYLDTNCVAKDLCPFSLDAGTLLMTEERQKATWAIYGKRLKSRIHKFARKLR